MSGRSLTFKNKLLQLIFNNVNYSYLGDMIGVRGSTSAGNLYLRLCTSATAVNDTTIGTEATFGGYPTKGLSVARNTTNWTVTNNQAKNAVLLTFPTTTSGLDVIRYFEIWIDNTSTTEASRLYWGQLDADKTAETGKAFSFAAESIIITEN
jgi:hypothetical protein